MTSWTRSKYRKVMGSVKQSLENYTPVTPQPLKVRSMLANGTVVCFVNMIKTEDGWQVVFVEYTRL